MLGAPAFKKQRKGTFSKKIYAKQLEGKNKRLKGIKIKHLPHFCFRSFRTFNFQFQVAWRPKLL